MQQPYEDEKDKDKRKSGRDDRPPIIVGNLTMFLDLREGRWEMGADNRKWTAKDNRSRPAAAPFHVRVLQGNDGCQDRRSGPSVRIEFGDGAHLNMTFAGIDPHVVSSVPLHVVDPGNPTRLLAPETPPHPVRRITVHGQQSCEFSGGGAVAIEITCTGDAG